MTDDDRQSYLLGLLDDPRADAIEHALLSDAAAFEAMRVAEDELFDDYLDGSLDRRRVAAFEARVAVVPGWGSRLAFARALAALPRAPAPSWRERLRAWWTMPRVLGLAMALVVALVVGRMALAPTGGEVAVGLQPDALRAASTFTHVTLSPDADTLALRLTVELPDEFASYHLTVDKGGARVADVAGLVVQDGAIVARIAASDLAAGSYALALAGERRVADGVRLEPVAFYTLVVVRAP